jgi:hypothetical protein
LARWLLALEGGFEDMFCEKEDYACYTTVVANSAVSWHNPLPESPPAILRKTLLSAFFRFLRGISVTRDFALQDWLRTKNFKFELSQELQLL